MANRRMFSLDIVDTDKFLDMPVSTQLLYFQLGMRADDDGFVSSPKKIANMIGANTDDLRLLVAKNFLIPFDDGVVVIVDWKVNNYIPKDRYKATRYKKELETLKIEENSYKFKTDTECIQDVYTMDTQDRIGKDRIGKDIYKQGSTQLPQDDPPEATKESRERVNYQQIADMYNDTCVSFPKVTTLSEKRKKAIRARMKQYSIEDFQRMFNLAEESDFMKGKNQRNWSATFDWMISDSNMAKILDGNYKNRDTKEGETFGTGEKTSREDKDLLANIRSAPSWHSPYPYPEEGGK